MNERFRNRRGEESDSGRAKNRDIYRERNIEGVMPSLRRKMQKREGFVEFGGKWGPLVTDFKSNSGFDFFFRTEEKKEREI